MHNSKVLKRNTSVASFYSCRRIFCEYLCNVTVSNRACQDVHLWYRLYCILFMICVSTHSPIGLQAISSKLQAICETVSCMGVMKNACVVSHASVTDEQKSCWNSNVLHSMGCLSDARQRVCEKYLDINCEMFMISNDFSAFGFSTSRKYFQCWRVSY